MSSEDNRRLEGLQQVLAVLREQLSQTGDWPDSAERLLTHLDQPSPLAPRSEEENDAVLSLIVSDALKGIDIADRYPTFFHKVMADEDLRQAFLDALEAMEESRQEAKPSLDIPQPAFDFLKAATPKPAIEYTFPAKWRIIWQQTIGQLESIFFPAATPQLAYRAVDDLEDPWFTLFRSDVEVAQAQLSVVLEVIWMTDTSDTLQMQVAAGFTLSPSEPIVPIPDLRAHLTWGQYEATVMITRRGRATFPPLPLYLVLDESARHVTADLQLTLEPAS
ncbi:MAG TPA: hypothetical protein VJG32_06075 [Anaerolineae bacterium]|nr:hypothetical protein [Anaerolineae bacterium]